MEALGVGSYLLIAIVLHMLFHERIRDWWLKRKVRSLVAFDRICRLADIGEKNLVFRIDRSSTFGASNGMRGRDFEVTFLYAAPMSLKAETRKFPKHHVVGEMRFDCFSDCTKIEEKVAESIIQVKAHYAGESVVAQPFGQHGPYA